MRPHQPPEGAGFHDPTGDAAVGEIARLAEGEGVAAPEVGGIHAAIAADVEAAHVDAGVPPVGEVDQHKPKMLGLGLEESGNDPLEGFAKGKILIVVAVEKFPIVGLVLPAGLPRWRAGRRGAGSRSRGCRLAGSRRDGPCQGAKQAGSRWKNVVDFLPPPSIGGGW